MTLRRFRVERLPGSDPMALAPSEAHHVARVLRLGVDSELVVFDGEGSQVRCRISTVGDQVTIEAVGPVEQQQPTQAAHLALALLKPKALDLALRMAVEAGITHLHIYVAERSQRRPPRLERWRKITDAAAKQCGRADLPQLGFYDDLKAVLTTVEAQFYLALPDAPSQPPLIRPAAAIVGPEGGFTPAEVDAALSVGAQPLGLGQWVLRADTAAVLACGYVCRSD